MNREYTTHGTSNRGSKSHGSKLSYNSTKFYR